MRTRHVKSVALVLIVASLGLLACDVSTLVGSIRGSSSKPTVAIQSPSNGSQFRDGEDIAIQSQARDSVGIVRVELSVDGAAIRTDQPPVPQGQVSFIVVQKWKATAGTHTLTVRAFNSAGVASDPALVTISVGSSVSSLEPTTAATQQAGLATLPAPTASPTVGLPTPTASRIPPTRIPPTATINAPPGVYATSIRVDPAAPKRGQPVTFRVTFLNTTGSPQGYRWRVAVFPPDQKNAKGDTAVIPSTIPVGMSEQASADNWTIRGPGPCESYLGRVFWVNQDTNQQTEFIKPDGSGGPAVGFQICP